MQLTELVTMDKDEAAEQAARYSELRCPTAEDRVILAGFLAMAAGKQLIDLPATIGAGGEFDDGLPKLAVMWADQPWAHVRRWSGGSVSFHHERYPVHNARHFAFTTGTLSERRTSANSWHGGMRSQVPMIPPQLRPKSPTALRRHAVLWEVEEWELAPLPPGDPALLRNLAGDLWTVEGVWDLTDLERLVLGHR